MNKTHSESTDEIANFYDVFNARLRRDFIQGNKRVSAAITRVCQAIDADTKSILDIGCGCGQLAWEYAKRHPNIEVHGLDISPVNIETAQRLFKLPNLSYGVSDLSVAPTTKYDLIAMIDMYEHVPKHIWGQFNRNISACMSEKAKIVLTTPTPLKQEYLKNNDPDELQIVDETVELNDLLKLAEDTGTKPVLFEWVEIWNRYDYTHFVSSSNLAALQDKRTGQTSGVIKKIQLRVQNYLESSKRKRLLNQNLNEQ